MVVVIALTAAAIAAGFPSALAIVAGSGVGTAVLARNLGNKRFEGAEEQSNGAIDRYPLAIPCERVRTKGFFLHPRFLPSVKAVYAPGVLCVAPGEVEFFPSSRRFADKAWRARVTRTEVIPTPWPACFVRLHGSDGAAQFSVSHPAKDVRGHLDPYLVVEG